LRQSLPRPDLAQVILEEIIEEGADRGDGRKPRHLIPARGDRGFKDVGGELEGEAGDKPATQAQPNVTLVVAVRLREHRPQALEEGLDRADDDEDQRQPVDRVDGDALAHIFDRWPMRRGNLDGRARRLQEVRNI